MKTEKLFLSFFIFLWLDIYTQEKVIEEIIIENYLNLPINKISENIEVITRSEIDASPTKSVEEILSQHTGLDIRRRGANGVQGDIGVRGGTFEQTLILINGVRINDSQTGHNTMNIPFDLDAVEKIEIIKGPAAWRFGQNAYAGVINIITKPSQSNDAKISTSGGDFGTYSLGLGINLASEKSSHFAQITNNHSEGYRYNTDYDINNAWYQNEFKLGKDVLKMQAGITKKKMGANGFYASPAAKNQYEELLTSLVSTQYQRKNEKVSLSSKIYWKRVEDMYLFVRNNPSLYRNLHIGNNMGLDANISIKSKLGTTGFGAEATKEFLQSNRLGKRNRWISNVFLEHRFRLLNDRLNILPGVSWAHYSNVGHYIYPKIDLGYRFDEHHKIYTNFAKVNRIPTYTDLYYSSITEIGNPLLQPESALSGELGYRFFKNRLEFKSSLFIRKSNDAIDWVKQDETDKWQAKNIGNTTNKGFEVSVKKNMDQIVQSFSVGYTYLDVTGDFENNYFSKYALENLKHQLTASLENKLLKNITSYLSYKYSHRINLPTYHVLDVKINYKHKNTNFYLLINNVTNTNYTETNLLPMPKRWFHFGANIKLGL